MKKYSIFITIGFLLLTTTCWAQEIQFNYRSVVENMKHLPEHRGYAHDGATAKMVNSTITVDEEKQNIIIVRNPGEPDSIRSIYYYDEKKLVAPNEYFFTGIHKDNKYYKIKITENSTNIGINCGPEPACEYLTVYVK